MRSNNDRLLEERSPQPTRSNISQSQQDKDMTFHLRVEPDISAIQMAKEFARVCNLPRGGTIEQAFLYFDPTNAAAWNDLCNQEDYCASFEGGLSLDWAADLIKGHLADSRFNKKTIDILGIGCGDGRKEGKLIQALLDVDSSLKINCHLIDKSYPLLSVAHAHLDELFLHTGRVKVMEYQANFWRLPYISQLFDTEESEKNLRIACMLGYTFGNLDGEIRFIRDSLSVLKPGDMFLVDAMLGFAAHDNADAIRHEDPRLAVQTSWKKGVNNWLETVLRHNRKECGTVSFESILAPRTSPLPNTYTLEVFANVESSKQTARFNMLRLHRYHQDSFIGTFMEEGLRRVGGKVFGANKRCLQYLFVKG